RRNDTPPATHRPAFSCGCCEAPRATRYTRAVSEELIVARIPYPDPSAYEHEPLAARIQSERGGKILNLYKMLLHSPPLAEGWLGFFTAIRQRAELPGRYRE